MKYEYRKGGYNWSVPAEVVGPELQRIWEEHGKQLKPADVEQEARASTAPLHGIFCWDDKRAGYRFRLHQARALMRSIIIIPVRGKEPMQQWRPIRKVEPERIVRAYQDIRILRENPDEWASALRILNRHLAAVGASIEELRSLASQKGENSQLQKISVLTEALATARTIADRLQ